MSTSAQVQGKVEYRLGDGPMQCVPPGAIEIDIGLNDVTMSWGTEDTRQSAAIPSSDFAKYVAAKAIVMQPQ
jgi:hypothetical protein